MAQTLRDQYPPRLIIGNEDCTFLLDSGCTFSNVDPGGFEAASFSIPKDMPNTLRGQYVRIDSGLQVAWEGRVSQVQRSLGSKTAINCEGAGAKLKDAAASMVFVDRDLTKWGSPSYARQVYLATVNDQLQSTAAAADSSGNPALIQTITGPWASPFFPLCEAWYDGGPENLIAKIYYALTVAGAPDPLNTHLVVDADNNFGSTTFLALSTGVSGSGYWTPGSQYRFALVQFAGSSTPGGTAGLNELAAWESLAVYGNHGLPGRGLDPVGFYPSDIAGWVISQAPGIQTGVIVPTDASQYIVEHAAYYTPENLDKMLNDMAVAQGWHWGVWESQSPLLGNPNPRCDFRPRPLPGAWTAFCRREDCDALDLREDLAQQFNRAIVNFTDVAGSAQAALVQIDNPILDEAGVFQRTTTFSGGTMTQATAAVFGLEALTILSAQQRVAGSANIIAAVYGPQGPKPPWLLRAGLDRLRIADVPSFDAWGSMSDFPISRVECSISSSGMNTAVEFGSGSNLVETLQSRLQSATVLAEQG